MIQSFDFQFHSRPRPAKARPKQLRSHESVVVLFPEWRRNNKMIHIFISAMNKSMGIIIPSNPTNPQKTMVETMVRPLKSKACVARMGSHRLDDMQALILEKEFVTLGCLVSVYDLFPWVSIVYECSIRWICFYISYALYMHFIVSSTILRHLWITGFEGLRVKLPAIHQKTEKDRKCNML